MAKKAKKPALPESTADVIERELAWNALRKRAAGQTPTGRELAALRAVERKEGELRRWEYYRTIPKKHWLAMANRSAQVVNDQADRYGIPLRGGKIDLPAVVFAIHEFFARNARKLARDDDGGAVSSALEESRRIRAAREKLDLAERQGQLVPREAVHECFGRLASVLRRAGEVLSRQFGAEAHGLLDDALLDAQREISNLLGSDSSDDQHPGGGK